MTAHSTQVDELPIRTNTGVAFKVVWAVIGATSGATLAVAALANHVNNLDVRYNEQSAEIREMHKEITSMRSTLDRIAGYMSANRQGGPTPTLKLMPDESQPGPDR